PLVSQRRRFTRSSSMMAICAAGPPNAVKPSRRKYRASCPRVARTGTSAERTLSLIVPFSLPHFSGLAREFVFACLEPGKSNILPQMHPQARISRREFALALGAGLLPRLRPPAAAPEFKALDHFEFYVSDVEKSRDLFVRLFGNTVLKGRTSSKRY